MILPKGWRVVKVSNRGLGDPQDGFKTSRNTWKVYSPDSDVAVEQFATMREAVHFVKSFSSPGCDCGADHRTEFCKEAR